MGEIMKEIKNNNKFTKINLKDYGVIIGFIVLCTIISISTPAFLTQKNILNLLRQSSIIGIISAGMTFVIISGNFDISVGAVAALSGAISMKFLSMSYPLPIALICSIIAGAIIGAINGFFVAKINIPSLIATMGMVTIVRGIILFLTGGYPISQNMPAFSAIGNGYFMKLPIPIIIFFIIVVISYIVLTKTKFGRHVYSVGGNPEASRLNGVNVDLCKIKVFIINGVLAALAGIVLAARLNTATPVAGEGYDMDAIASVVIGGTSVTGGEGSVLKTVIGVLFMSVINNSFNLLGVNIYFQYIFKGLIILSAVGFDAYSRKKLSSN